MLSENPLASDSPQVNFFQETPAAFPQSVPDLALALLGIAPDLALILHSIAPDLALTLHSMFPDKTF